MNTGKLYLCATPIGNLDDMTFRVIKTLEKVSMIYAEDTRHTIKLLNYFEIKNKLKSYHEHNRRKMGPIIIEQLEAGEELALVTDAGMPGISDPGSDLVKLCIEHDIPFEVIPGPTAFVVALIQSGMNTERFAFEGFLPRKKKDKEDHLEKIKSDDRTLIFYESPHRLKKTLKSMLKVLGNRRIAISREMTKKYEEVLRFDLESAITYYNEHDPRGEFVLTLEGNSSSDSAETFDLSIREHIILEMEKGLSKKQAIKEVARVRKLNKNEVYKESFDIDIRL